MIRIKFIYIIVVVVALLFLIWIMSVYQSVEEGGLYFDANNVKPYEGKVTPAELAITFEKPDSSQKKKGISVQSSKGGENNGTKDANRRLSNKNNKQIKQDSAPFEDLHALDERFLKDEYAGSQNLDEEIYIKTDKELMLESEDSNNVLGRSFKKFKEVSMKRELNERTKPLHSLRGSNDNSLNEDYSIELKARRGQRADLNQERNLHLNKVVVDEEDIEKILKVISENYESIPTKRKAQAGIFTESLDERSLQE